MKLVRVFRVTGDALTCLFSPEGALSSATLKVEEREHNVAGQLPGLTAAVVERYLTELGFSVSSEPGCTRLGRVLNECLQDTELFVESVVEHGPQAVVSVALAQDRRRVCPRRAFVAILNCETDSWRFEAVRNAVHVEEFHRRTQLPGSEYNV